MVFKSLDIAGSIALTQESFLQIVQSSRSKHLTQDEPRSCHQDRAKSPQGQQDQHHETAIVHQVIQTPCCCQWSGFIDKHQETFRISASQRGGPGREEETEGCHETQAGASPFDSSRFMPCQVIAFNHVQRMRSKALRQFGVDLPDPRRFEEEPLQNFKL
jgi:hypothetical protein